MAEIETEPVIIYCPDCIFTLCWGISFDLVVSYQYKKEDEARVVYQVVAFMHALDPRNQCVITIDRGAVEEKMSGIVDTDSIKN